jgi:hypothetical protein
MLELKRLGNLRSAAAPMMGVASKKLKRAASSLLSPASSPPAIDDPDLDMPGKSAAA